MVRTLRQMLEKQLVAKPAPEQAEQNRLKNTIVVLSWYQSEGIPVLSPATRREGRADIDRRDVFDELTTLIRYQLLHAESVGETSRANALRQTLDTAYGQRAELTYLRPASAFLRSANAATTLQGSSLEPKRNLLPLGIGNQSIYTREEMQNKLELQKASIEIDKQFWQSVNTVKVSGGGNTNYVLAKDDIGNWYVKTYTTDPTPIIRSAQSLALFSLGRNYDVNLLGRAQLQDQLDSTPATDVEKRKALNDELGKFKGKQSTVDTGGFQRVLDRYKSEYATATDSQYNKLKTQIDSNKLGDDIAKAWAANDNTKDAAAIANTDGQQLPKLLTAAMKGIDSNDLNPKTNGTATYENALKQENEMWTALRKIQAACRTLRNNIGNAPSGKIVKADGTTDVRKDAQTIAASICAKMLTDFSNQRIEAVKKIETSIVFVGEASKP